MPLINEINIDTYHYCLNPDVTVLNGRQTNEGIVLVRANASLPWTTLCDEGWDDKAAGVVCRMMGYKGNLSVTLLKHGCAQDKRSNLDWKFHQFRLRAILWWYTVQYTTASDDLNVTGWITCPWYTPYRTDM